MTFFSTSVLYKTIQKLPKEMPTTYFTLLSQTITSEKDKNVDNWKNKHNAKSCEERALLL